MIPAGSIRSRLKGSKSVPAKLNLSKSFSARLGSKVLFVPSGDIDSDGVCSPDSPTLPPLPVRAPVTPDRGPERAEGPGGHLVCTPRKLKKAWPPALEDSAACWSEVDETGVTLRPVRSERSLRGQTPPLSALSRPCPDASPSRAPPPPPLLRTPPRSKPAPTAASFPLPPPRTPRNPRVLGPADGLPLAIDLSPSMLTALEVLAELESDDDGSCGTPFAFCAPLPTTPPPRPRLQRPKLSRAGPFPGKPAGTLTSLDPAADEDDRSGLDRDDEGMSEEAEDSMPESPWDSDEEPGTVVVSPRMAPLPQPTGYPFPSRPRIRRIAPDESLKSQGDSAPSSPIDIGDVSCSSAASDVSFAFSVYPHSCPNSPATPFTAAARRCSIVPPSLSPASPYSSGNMDHPAHLSLHLRPAFHLPLPSASTSTSPPRAPMFGSSRLKAKRLQSKQAFGVSLSDDEEVTGTHFGIPDSPKLRGLARAKAKAKAKSLLPALSGLSQTLAVPRTPKPAAVVVTPEPLHAAEGEPALHHWWEVVPGIFADR